MASVERVALNGGFYRGRGLIASAQRCLNLFPERTPPESGPPTPTITLLTPGLRRLCAAHVVTDEVSGCRLLYTASNGDLYAVIGRKVYFVTSAWTQTEIGTIPLNTTLCSMRDNGLVAVLVDGSPTGYYIDLETRTMTTIDDEAFYGADVVEYLDTFFIFNRPNTNQFYWSPSEWDGLEAFDPLDIAAKVGTPDNIAWLLVSHREIWLIGANKGTEVWYNSGNADTTFERLPGVFINHGCAARYSACRQDVSTYWLSRDEQGQAIALCGVNYEAKRISTHAIENEFASYSTVEDAQGFIYQQEGHTFWVLTFPSADKTWAYDIATGLWHERAWIDTDGCEHRIRPNCAAFAYETNVVGDWEDGRLFAYDLNTYTDDGDPITRRRGFPHIVDNGDRVFHLNFIADMQVGTAPGLLDIDEPQVNLRYSDTRGASWGYPVRQGMGSTGQYLRSIQFNQLGMARDRVYELFWSAPYQTALQGGWLTTRTAGS